MEVFLVPKLLLLMQRVYLARDPLKFNFKIKLEHRKHMKYVGAKIRWKEKIHQMLVFQKLFNWLNYKGVKTMIYL